MKKITSLLVMFIITLFTFISVLYLENSLFVKVIIKQDKKNMLVENGVEQVMGTFSPIINLSIEQAQEYYKKGDKVLLKVEITNVESFSINNLVLKLNDSGVEFLPNDNYEVNNKKQARIKSIEANQTFTLYGIYKVDSNDIKDITAEVVIIDGRSENKFILDSNLEHKKDITFKVGCAILEVINKEEKTKAKDAVFGLYKDSDCLELISAGLVFENLTPGTIYYLKEITPPKNCTLYKDTLAVIVDDTGKIQLKKYVSSGNIQYRAINSNNEVPITKGDGTAVLTLSRTAINMLPYVRGQSNFYYVLVGALLTITSICFYIYYVRKKAI